MKCYLANNYAYVLFQPKQRRNTDTAQIALYTDFPSSTNTYTDYKYTEVSVSVIKGGSESEEKKETESDHTVTSAISAPSGQNENMLLTVHPRLLVSLSSSPFSPPDGRISSSASPAQTEWSPDSHM